jgi:hypothetical protein
MTDDATRLSADDWAALLDALNHASEDMGYDLHDTRNSDFYDPEDRKEREDKLANWERLARILAPLASQASDASGCTEISTKEGFDEGTGSV